MSDLVDKLSEGDHAVTVKRYETVDQLKEAIERGFVLVKFTGTQGGTEVGYEIDVQKSELDLSGSKEEICLIGRFELDFIPVECSAKINLNSLEGSGRLYTIEDKSEVKLN